MVKVSIIPFFIYVILLSLIYLLLVTKLQADSEIQPWSMPTETALNEAHYPYPDEFIRIGGCESVGSPYGKWDYHAKNPYSSASGAFQFINKSWYDYGREYWGEEFYEKNIWTEDNVELAWYVYNKYGTKDWLESKKCWSVL